MANNRLDAIHSNGIFHHSDSDISISSAETEITNRLRQELLLKRSNPADRPGAESSDDSWNRYQDYSGLSGGGVNDRGSCPDDVTVVSIDGASTITAALTSSPPNGDFDSLFIKAGDSPLGSADAAAGGNLHAKLHADRNGHCYGDALLHRQREGHELQRLRTNVEPPQGCEPLEEQPSLSSFFVKPNVIAVAEVLAAGAVAAAEARAAAIAAGAIPPDSPPTANVAIPGLVGLQYEDGIRRMKSWTHQRSALPPTEVRRPAAGEGSQTSTAPVTPMSVRRAVPSQDAARSRSTTPVRVMIGPSRNSTPGRYDGGLTGQQGSIAASTGGGAGSSSISAPSGAGGGQGAGGGGGAGQCHTACRIAAPVAAAQGKVIRMFSIGATVPTLVTAGSPASSSSAAAPPPYPAVTGATVSSPSCSSRQGGGATTHLRQQPPLSQRQTPSSTGVSSPLVLSRSAVPASISVLPAAGVETRQRSHSSAPTGAAAPPRRATFGAVEGSQQVAEDSHAPAAGVRFVVRHAPPGVTPPQRSRRRRAGADDEEDQGGFSPASRSHHSSQDGDLGAAKGRNGKGPALRERLVQSAPVGKVQGHGSILTSAAGGGAGSSSISTASGGQPTWRSAAPLTTAQGKVVRMVSVGAAPGPPTLVTLGSTAPATSSTPACAPPNPATAAAAAVSTPSGSSYVHGMAKLQQQQSQPLSTGMSSPVVLSRSAVPASISALPVSVDARQRAHSSAPPGAAIFPRRATLGGSVDGSQHLAPASGTQSSIRT